MLCLVSLAHRVLHAEALHRALDSRAPGSKMTVLISQFHWSYEEALGLIPWFKMVAMGRVQRCWAQHCESQHTRASPEGAPLLPHSCHCCSVTKSCPALCDPMDYIAHQASLSSSSPMMSLLNHVHWVGDTIQPSHPLSSPSPAFNLSQHQGLFQWVSSSHQVAKGLEFQLQHQSFQWISLGLTGLISLQSKGFSESSPAPQFESINSLVLTLRFGPALTSIHSYWKNHSIDYTDLCWQSDVFPF